MRAGRLGRAVGTWVVLHSTVAEAFRIVGYSSVAVELGQSSHCRLGQHNHLGCKSVVDKLVDLHTDFWIHLENMGRKHEIVLEQRTMRWYDEVYTKKVTYVRQHKGAEIPTQ